MGLPLYLIWCRMTSTIYFANWFCTYIPSYVFPWHIPKFNSHIAHVHMFWCMWCWKYYWDVIWWCWSSVHVPSFMIHVFCNQSSISFQNTRLYFFLYHHWMKKFVVMQISLDPRQKNPLTAMLSVFANFYYIIFYDCLK